MSARSCMRQACGSCACDGAHKRHVVSVATAAQQKQAVGACSCSGVHPGARPLAARLHALPLVGLHGSVERPRIRKRLWCTLFCVRRLPACSAANTRASSTRRRAVPCNRRCPQARAGNADQRAQGREHSAHRAPRLAQPAKRVQARLGCCTARKYTRISRKRARAAHETARRSHHTVPAWRVGEVQHVQVIRRKACRTDAALAVQRISGA